MASNSKNAQISPVAEFERKNTNIRQKMKNSSPKKVGCWLPLAIVIIFFVGIALYNKVSPSAERRALPESATEIEEYYWEGGFMAQDFTRCLKAKIPRSEFAAYAHRLNFPHRYVKGENIESKTGLDFGPGLARPWFDPPRAVEADDVYYDSGQTYAATLKYKEPYVYLIIVDW